MDDEEAIEEKYWPALWTPDQEAFLAKFMKSPEFLAYGRRLARWEAAAKAMEAAGFPARRGQAVNSHFDYMKGKQETKHRINETSNKDDANADTHSQAAQSEHGDEDRASRESTPSENSDAEDEQERAEESEMGEQVEDESHENAAGSSSGDEAGAGEVENSSDIDFKSQLLQSLASSHAQLTDAHVRLAELATKMADIE